VAVVVAVEQLLETVKVTFLYFPRVEQLLQVVSTVVGVVELLVITLRDKPLLREPVDPE
jgi:hypothetical protein